MLIICCGPDNFSARQKSRELVAAFKQKHDPTASSIETLVSANLYKDVLGRLSLPSLFSTKKMIRCERLFDKMVIAQAKQLAKAVEKDPDTIVLDYEDKKPADKNLGVFQDKTLFVYEYPGLTGTALLKQVQLMCQRYGLPATCAQDMIAEFENDLWAIDTSLQMLRIDSSDRGSSNVLKQIDNVFQVSDMYLDGKTQWKEYWRDLEPQEFMSVLLSQLRSWTRIKAGQVDGIHPFVQKKLGYKKIAGASELTKQIIRAIAASRQSLAVGDEILQLI